MLMMMLGRGMHSLDVVFTTLLSLAWMTLHDSVPVPRTTVAALVAVTPLVSIATTFPAYLAIRETYRQVGNRKKNE